MGSGFKLKGFLGSTRNLLWFILRSYPFYYRMAVGLLCWLARVRPRAAHLIA